MSVRRDLVPILLLLGAVILIFSPLLFFGQMPAGQEDFGVYYPGALHYQRVLQSGGSTFWDSSYYGGFPSFLNMFVGVLHPLHYALFTFLPFFSAYHVALALAVFEGMAFAYLFGRAKGFSTAGSLVLSLSYAIGVTPGALDTGLSYANGFLVLPLFFWAIEIFFQENGVRRKLGALAVGVIGAVVGLLAGFPQIVLYAFAFAFAYAVFLDFSRRPHVFRATVGFVSIAFAGALLAFPQLVALFRYLPSSIRVSDYTAQVSEFLPPFEWIYFFLPPTFDLPRLAVSIPGLYVGALPLLLVLAALFFFRNKFVWFFFGSYLVMAAMAFNFPVISLVNTHLPIFSRISNPARWLYIGAFALSVLAAMGYEGIRGALREWFCAPAFQKFSRVVWWGIGVLAVGVVTAHVALQRLLEDAALRESVVARLSARIGGSLEEHRVTFLYMLHEATRGFSLTNPVFLLLLLLLPVAWWVLTRAHANRFFPRIAVSLVVINFFLMGAAWWQILVPRALFLETPAAIHAIEAERKAEEPFRIVSFLGGDVVFQKISSDPTRSLEKRAVLNREVLTGQIAGVSEVDTLGGYEPFRPLRHNQLIDTVLAPNDLAVFDADAVRQGVRLDEKVNTRALRRAAPEEKTEDIARRLPLLSMMNVKYILSPYPIASSKLRAIPFPADAQPPLVLFLYENRDVMPRVYAAEDIRFWKGSERDLLLAVADAKDFRKGTFIECAECSDADAVSTPAKIEVLSRTSGMWELRVEAEKDAWIVVSESHLPGWVAEVDGARVPIHTANYLFQAVRVPAGTHHVSLRYSGPFAQWRETIGSF